MTYILSMIVLFYGAGSITSQQLTVEYSSMAACEAASKANAASLVKNNEGKVVMATCSAK